MAGSKATRDRAKQRKRSRLRLGLHRRKPLKPDDTTRIHSFLQLQTKPKLVSFLLDAALSDPEIRTRIGSIADSDESRRKIFVHGLGADSTDETLAEAFSPFGSIEDCSVVRDKVTDRAKGYGFVVYKTRSGAEKALKEPKKRVKNWTIMCQLASVGPARADDSMPSSIGRTHMRNLPPLMERPVFMDAAMNHGMVRMPYGGGAMRFPYGGGMFRVPYGGESTRLSYDRGAGEMPYGGGRMAE